MKTKCNAVIVVEGKSDVQFLESFLDAEFVITNGSEVSRETIEYIRSLSMIKKVIVLTDPDSPGKRIRDILDNEIPNLSHAFVEKNKSIKKHKVGVAESSKEHILEAISNLLEKNELVQGTLTMRDLYTLDLCGKDYSNSLRVKVMSELHLGYGNAKTLLKRLNSMNIDYDKLKSVVEKVK
ncbi:MAG: ribonuclease M5 [Erysipelotrichales bacterium]|nr:ribonuclease M5 [Erysipelotrichales bacterium]